MIMMMIIHNLLLIPAVNRDCGGNQTGREGIITSPNYPNNYDSLTECQWLITVNPAFTIRFEIEYSFPYNSYRCSADGLVVSCAGY